MDYGSDISTMNFTLFSDTNRVVREIKAKDRVQ